MFKRTVMLFAAAAFLVGISLAFVNRGMCDLDEEQSRKYDINGKNVDEKVAKLTKILNLTPEQQEKIKSIATGGRASAKTVSKTVPDKVWEDVMAKMRSENE